MIMMMFDGAKAKLFLVLSKKVLAFLEMIIKQKGKDRKEEAGIRCEERVWS